MSHTVTFPNIKVEVRLTIRFREDEWERWAEGWTDEEQWSLKIRQRKTLRHLIARINKRASRQVHDTGYTWTAEGLLDRDGDAFDLAEQVWAVKDFAMPFIVVTSERVPVPVLSLDSILTERQLAMSSCDCMVVQGPQRPRSPKAHGVETSSLTSPVRPCIHQAVNYNDPEHKAANDAWVQSLREEAQAIKDGQERIKRQAQRVAERAARHRELTRLAEAYQRERERKREAIRVEAERQAIAFAYEYAVSHNIPGRNQQPPKTDCNSDGQSSNFSQKLKERLDLAVSNSEKNRRLTAKPIEPVAPIPICWEEVESDTTTAESCRDDSESEDEQEESPTARKSAQSQTRLPRTATPLHNRKRTDSKDEDEDASPITREAARSQHCALRQATPSPGTERVGANDGQYREPLAAPSLDPERGGVHLSLEVAEVGYRPAICREVSAPRRRTAKRARHEQPAAGDNKRRRHAVPGTAE